MDPEEVDLQEVMRRIKDRFRQHGRGDAEKLASDQLEANEIMRGEIAHPTSVSGKEVVDFKMDVFDGDQAFKDATGKR